MFRMHTLLDEAIGCPRKCELLVHIHAWFLGISHIPRVFLPDEITELEAANLLEFLLLTHPVGISQKTKSAARPFVAEFPTSDINSKAAILQDIEAVIPSGLGLGKIIYEESRFTPYGTSLYSEAASLIISGSPIISRARLDRREKARTRAPYQNRTGTPCNPVRRSLRASYEQEWALSWMNSTSYLKPGAATKTVGTLILPVFGDQSCS